MGVVSGLEHVWKHVWRIVSVCRRFLLARVGQAFQWRCGPTDEGLGITMTALSPAVCVRHESAVFHCLVVSPAQCSYVLCDLGRRRRVCGAYVALCGAFARGRTSCCCCCRLDSTGAECWMASPRLDGCATLVVQTMQFVMPRSTALDEFGRLGHMWLLLGGAI